MASALEHASSVGAGKCAPCDYRGAFDPSKCRTGCGHPSQALYHVPVAWLNANAGERLRPDNR